PFGSDLSPCLFVCCTFMAPFQHTRRLVVLAALPETVTGHSWVACTDYRGDVNYFEQEKCEAWPRQWWNRGERNAPQPNGYHIAEEPPSRAWQGLGCDVAMAAPSWQDGYSPDFPFAIYEAGRVYCLAWPMKNHGVLPAGCHVQQSKSDEGQNESLTLLVSAVGPQVDPSQEEFDLRNINELGGLARNCSGGGPSDACQLGLERHRTGEADCKGFTRAPRFCESSGAALGTGCFKVPEGMVPGHYVAQWRWDASFPRSGGTQHSTYTSCFDFQVVPRGSGSARQGQPGTVGTPDSDLPCQNNVLKFDGDSATATPSTATAAPGAVPAPPPTPAPTRSCAAAYEICADPTGTARAAAGRGTTACMRTRTGPRVSLCQPSRPCPPGSPPMSGELSAFARQGPLATSGSNATLQRTEAFSPEALPTAGVTAGSCR
ncbi:unnamed protein product, partial [Prorocentrum cordatum]